MKRGGRIFIDTLKRNRSGILAFLLSAAVSAAVFILYGLSAEPFLYAWLLICFLAAVLFAVSFAKAYAKAVQRERMLRAALTEAVLPPADTLAEEDYQEMIRILKQELTDLRNRYETGRQDEIDYYTAWVHQIKTPIAVMRMELGGGDTECTRALEAELFRVEQYVDMVLQYIRLGSGTSADGNGCDLLIGEYPADGLIRDAVRKFAPQFVAKRLRLSYGGAEGILVTDKKWFSCILEQLLSNAIKYTPAGGCISVSLHGNSLQIADTGIGIAPEDLPRIFERGYTGGNGRLDKCSSGLGLYLCRKAADLLRIPVSVSSRVGEGSCFSLDLSGKLKP